MKNKRIGIFLLHQRQQPFAVFDGVNWRIWISYNIEVTSGTYLLLYPNGHMDRVTVNDNEIMDITLIN